MPISVNGELLDEQAVRAEAGIMKARLREETPDKDELALDLQAWEWARENVIERVLLRQAARLEAEPEDAADAEALVERLVAKITATVQRPTTREVSAVYQGQRSRFVAPEKVRALHIVKNVDEVTQEADAECEIRKVHERLLRGEDFAEVADRHSDCPGRGGDLGYFARGEMVPEFEQVVFALKPGDTSGVFRTAFGYHIAKLIDRRAPRAIPLQEVRKELEDVLWSTWKETAVEQYLDSLRAKADIRKTRAEAAL